MLSNFNEIDGIISGFCFLVNSIEPVDNNYNTLSSDQIQFNVKALYRVSSRASQPYIYAGSREANWKIHSCSNRLVVIIAFKIHRGSPRG